MPPLTIRIVESNAEISRKVLKSLAKSLNKAAMSALPEITQEIKKIVKAAIEGSREYSELQGGTLQAELGVPNAPSRLSKITDIWLSNISIKRKPIMMFYLRQNLHIQQIKERISLGLNGF
jgi:hypothetical protein